MTEAFKYTWLLLKEEPVYIPLIFMITGTGVISVFFVLKDFRSWWSKLILLVIDVLFCLFIFIAALEPESTYKNIQQRKENISFTLKNCKISAFEAQQAGLFGTTKDAWSCPDGITRYLPVKYRPEAGSSEKMQSEAH